MKQLKMISILAALGLTGCVNGQLFTGTLIDPIVMVARENHKLGNMTPIERCNNIRVDLREDCRNNYKKEVDELSAAMQKNN